jgi:hypothetical protein
VSNKLHRETVLCITSIEGLQYVFFQTQVTLNVTITVDRKCACLNKAEMEKTWTMFILSLFFIFCSFSTIHSSSAFPSFVPLLSFTCPPISTFYSACLPLSLIQCYILLLLHLLFLWLIFHPLLSISLSSSSTSFSFCSF